MPVIMSTCNKWAIKYGINSWNNCLVLGNNEDFTYIIQRPTLQKVGIILCFHFIDVFQGIAQLTSLYFIYTWIISYLSIGERVEVDYLSTTFKLFSRSDYDSGNWCWWESTYYISDQDGLFSWELLPWELEQKLEMLI